MRIDINLDDATSAWNVQGVSAMSALGHANMNIIEEPKRFPMLHSTTGEVCQVSMEDILEILS